MLIELCSLLSLTTGNVGVVDTLPPREESPAPWGLYVGATEGWGQPIQLRSPGAHKIGCDAEQPNCTAKLGKFENLMGRRRIWLVTGGRAKRLTWELRLSASSANNDGLVPLLYTAVGWRLYERDWGSGDVIGLLGLDKFEFHNHASTTHFAGGLAFRHTNRIAPVAALFIELNARAMPVTHWTTWDDGGGSYERTGWVAVAGASVGLLLGYQP